MSQYPKLNEHPARIQQWVLLNLFFFGLFVSCFGPVNSALALYFQHRVRGLKRISGAVVVTLGWGPVLYRYLPHELSLGALLASWALMLPLVPAAALLLKGMIMFSYFLKPKTLSEDLAEKSRAQTAFNQQLSQQANQVPEIPPVPNALRMGATIRNDRFPSHMGVTVDRRWLLLNESVLDQHVFILGATGSGKTEAIKRLVHELLISTDRHIYFVDGKGDEELAQALRSQIYHHTQQLAPIFRLGLDRFGAVYNGFCGHPRALFNRLLALLHIDESEGNARYYADVNRDLLQLICYAPQGPPRNFEEVEERLDKTWLLHAYRTQQREVRAISKITPKSFDELAPRLRSLLREFLPCVGEEGFALETTPFAIFSLRTQSVGDTARRFLDFLIEDLKDFVGKRQRHPGVLIIDEFGQFDNAGIVDLLTLARTYRMGIVLATQDLSTLRDPVVTKQVLSSTRTRLLMATDYPDELGKLAGTILRVEASLQHEEGNPTGLGSARIQDSFKIDMNEVAQLPPGEAFLIRQRCTAKLRIRVVDEPMISAAEQAEEVRNMSPYGATQNSPVTDDEEPLEDIAI